MANRIMLNETSYHGAGAIEEIANEAKAHAFKKAFVCSDPEMMSSMPKGLTASTGMDALTHAIEGYTTKAAWEMTDMFHLKAIEIISRFLRSAVANEKEGREGMALGQYIAGMGFSNVGLGIAHSMAHTLGAVYDAPQVQFSCNASWHLPVHI